MGVGSSYTMDGSSGDSGMIISLAVMSNDMSGAISRSGFVMLASTKS